MNQVEKAVGFAKLHAKGNPVLLYNVWDAGSAKSVLAGGAPAIATSSWSVAQAQGYSDGEEIPLGFVERIIARIVASVDAPVSVDFEGGYSDDDGELAGNVARLLDLGIVGINFEDRVVKGAGLYSIDRQAQRIATIRRVATEKGVPLFVNARTDVFFGEKRDAASAVSAALDRAKAYAAAGASGFFIPGLSNEASIEKVCEGASLPINVMVIEGVPSMSRLAQLGVARISYGPIPYLNAMNALTEEAKAHCVRAVPAERLIPAT